jgi:hypothetical protein
MQAVSPFPVLAFPDVEAGAGYLSRLPLANPAAAEQQIIQFLDSLLAAPPEQSDLLALLEQLRVPMAYVEEEMGRRYHNKPVVLGDVEERCFQQVLSAWCKLGKAYALCLEPGPAPAGAEDASQVALVLHRRLHCSGMVILEHYRARRELPAGLWREFHGHYHAAEQWGVATTPVPDGIDGDGPATHCTAAYVTLLLIDVASPYSQNVRDINLIRRWATRWAPLVSVHRLEGEGRMPPYLIELGKDTGLHPAGKNHSAVADHRGLDTSRIAREIDRTLGQLREKIPPSRLGLGEEAPGLVSGLLEQLSRPWSQLAVPRKFRRFAASGTARVCLGFEAMHFAVTGRAFEQPEAAGTYFRGELHSLFNFRGTIVPNQRPTIRSQDDFPVDQWEVINHSANGFRLARSSVGQKMSHGQLLALCPHDGGRYLLAQNCWLMQEREGGLVAGVSVLPGLPTGVAVRINDDGRGGNRPFVRGFLMSPVPNVAEKGSIVLPTGTYQASRVYDIYADGFWQIRLKNILQRGTDFERVSFETV